MSKIFLIMALACATLQAAEEYIGRWSFIFYEKAASFDSLMPQPIFNEVEFKKDGTANVRIRAKDMALDLPYLVNEKFIGMKLPLKGQYEEPVRFKAEYHYSEKDGTLTIKGQNASAVYIRTETLLPMDNLTGVWLNSGRFDEYMEILKNGLLKLQVTGLTGFCVLWKDNCGIENLTMVGGMKNALPHTFIWQIHHKDDNSIEMVPVTHEGSKPKSATLWKRIK